MGSIRKAVTDFSGEQELKNTQKELVSTLAALAESRADHYVAEITRELLEAGTAGNWTIPIKAVLKTTKHTHAYSSTSADNISGSVNTALQSFVTGGKQSIVSGVGNLISSAITAFLGEASASTGDMQEYYVMTEGLSIVRIDVYGWYLNVQAEAIQRQMERVSAFVGFKSAVDIAKLDYNSFLNLYQDQMTLSASPTSEEIAKELDNVYKIFEKFKGLELERGSIG